MMYPPLARVKYEELHRVFGQFKILALSLIHELGHRAGADVSPGHHLSLGYPEYAVGLILVGLARCIAMVIVWNELAGGAPGILCRPGGLQRHLPDGPLAVYAYLFISVLPKWLGLAFARDIQVGILDVVVTVLIYLGIPFFSGL